MKFYKYISVKGLALALTAGVFVMSLFAGCGTTDTVASTAETAESAVSEAFGSAEVSDEVQESTSDQESTSESTVEATVETATVQTGDSVVTVANVTDSGILDATEFFTDRDLTQTPDLTDAEVISVTEDVHITAEGVYVLTGTASDVTIYVEAPTDAKVQLVMDNLNITNQDFPCIYVTSADKVFVTTVSDSTLSVTGSFTADGDTNTDGVIFCRSDLVLNGTAALTINSSDNGVVCKDDLKITGGTYNITASSKAVEANDSIRIAGGVLNLTAGTDGLHAENDEDDTLGYIYICGGTLNIDAGDDAIHAVSVVQIDGGTIAINAAEGIEATYIQINDGTIDLSASDDGINGAQKSSAYYATIEINGGTTTVIMGAGDTDGVDSNGDIIINGGYIDVTGQSTFDYDGTGTYNGGTIIVNGQQVDSIPNQMMGGRGMR